ncbi:VanZ family protein [Peptoniphilus sp. oral taxon 386]|nr:VanZ family protein [Peptoniphilus sp. oral taxon 386]
MIGILVFVFTFILFSLIRTNFFKSLKRKSNPKRELILSIFVAYIAVMCLLLFLPNVFMSNHGIDLTSQNFDFVGDFKDRISAGSWGVNIIPFRTMKSYIKYSGVFHVFLNIAGNILIFIPFGTMLPMLYDDMRKFYRVAVLSATFSFLVEIVQFFVGRSVDIDDFILNTIGGMIGYFVFKMIQNKYN